MINRRGLFSSFASLFGIAVAYAQRDDFIPSTGLPKITKVTAIGGAFPVQVFDQRGWIVELIEATEVTYYSDYAIAHLGQGKTRRFDSSERRLVLPAIQLPPVECSTIK